MNNLGPKKTFRQAYADRNQRHSRLQRVNAGKNDSDNPQACVDDFKSLTHRAERKGEERKNCGRRFQ